MIRGLFVLLFLACSFDVHAGYASAAFSGGLSKSAGSWTVKGSAATAANSAFTTPATVSVAGKLVTMPASASFAANAAAFAVTTARGNPTGMGVALTGFLASAALSYAVDHWVKTTQAPADSSGNVGFIWLGYASITSSSSSGACTASQSHPDLHGSGSYVSGSIVTATAGPCQGKLVQSCTITGRGSDYSDYSFSVCRNPTCATGYTMSGGVCVPDAQSSPATEADFTNAAAQPLTDAVAQELARANLPVPVNPPVLNSTPVVSPIGDPYIDPVTGQTIQPYVKVTPSPTVDDPARVDIIPFNKEIAAADPAKAETGAIAPKAEAPPTDCDKYPNSLGCIDAGDSTDDQTLQTKDVALSLTPVPVGDAGSCPATKTFTHAGTSYSFSYAPICTGATLIKPVVLAIAWLLAAYIVIGSVRET